MAFFYWQVYTRSDTTFSYVAGSCTLLLVSVVDIILSIFTFSTPPIIVLLLGSSRPPAFAGFSGYSPISAGCGITAGADAVFWGWPHSFGSPVSAFYLSPAKGVRQLMLIGYSIRSLAPYLDLLTYKSLTIRICWVFGAHTWTCLIISRL